jgi:formate hydrogenlyase subunit 3/multisubunit Na+/H+ antiporter MnhD subunit
VTGWHLFVEAAGWFAALAILGAYFLLSVGRVDGRSATYQWMNVFGAVGFIINSGWHGALPSVALNVVWLAIGAYALRRNRAARRA